MGDLTEEQRAAADCIVARCGKCNRVVVAGVEDSINARELARLVRAGCNITHHPVAEVRAMPFMCECKRAAAQREPQER